MIEVKTPSFATVEEADEWLSRAELFQQVVAGRHSDWGAEDGSNIGYATAALPGGGFASYRYRGSAVDEPLELVFVKKHPTRKAARARAVALYKKYSPKFAKKHPDFK